MSFRCLNLSLALVCLALAVPGAAEAEVRTFRAPTYGGYAISFCGADSSTCGETVATSWCRSQSFDFATEWAVISGVVDQVSVRLEDGTICRGAQCEAFNSITCSRDRNEFRMPRLGGIGRVTLIEPGRRGTAASYETVEFTALIPGCHQREPGVYMCESEHEYQHCRTLMTLGHVYSCRAGMAFDGGFAEPVVPTGDQYDLRVRSNVEIRVARGSRGEGRSKGEANVEVRFDPPVADAGSICLQRDRYVYYPTGPMGGLGEIGGTDDCDEPVETEFIPHEDDMLVAYDMCDAFASWGGEIEHSIDIMVGALFHVAPVSASTSLPEPPVVIAPYLTVEAPVRIECRE